MADLNTRSRNHERSEWSVFSKFKSARTHHSCREQTASGRCDREGDLKQGTKRSGVTEVQIRPDPSNSRGATEQRRERESSGRFEAGSERSERPRFKSARTPCTRPAIVSDPRVREGANPPGRHDGIGSPTIPAGFVRGFPGADGLGLRWPAQRIETGAVASAPTAGIQYDGPGNRRAGPGVR
jgi:hypothetical protein